MLQPKTGGPTKISARHATAKATSGADAPPDDYSVGERAKLAVLVAPRPNSVHWTQTAIQWATLARWAADPADTKECGNYVLGEFRHTRRPKCPDTCDELHRNKAAVVSRGALTLDADKADAGLADAVEALGYDAVVHPTFRSTPDQLRARVIIRLDRDATPEEYGRLARALMQELGSEQFDPGSDQPERYMFKPSTQDPDTYWFRVVAGEPLPVADWLARADAAAAVAAEGLPAGQGLHPYARSVVEAELARLDDCADGAELWDTTTYEVACNLIELANSPWSGYTRDVALADLLERAPQDDGFGPAEHLAKWDSAEGKVGDRGRPDPDAEADFEQVDPTKGPRHLDELRMAAYAARAFLGDYCWAGRWYRWTGTVWAEATDVTVMEVMRAGMLHMVKAELDAGADDGRRSALVKLLSVGKVRSIASMARGLVERDPAKFDADPWLLNTPSGVVDLRTGELGPHDRNLLMTKMTRDSYVPGATHPDWERALAALAPAEVRWLQRWAGQAATGEMPSEDRMLVAQGGGSNGKTSVFGGLMGALGGYATVVPEKLLTANPNDHSTELTTLQGVRLALIEETPEARQLSVKRLKDTVGTPYITARRIRQDNVTWKATHTLALTTNYMPRLNETDHGTWRRLALLRFTKRFEGKAKDPNLRRLVVSGAGGRGEAVLAWIVEGARLYHRQGLEELTPRMEADMAQWKLEADPLSRFLAERVVFDPDSHVVGSVLFDAFNEYLHEQGLQVWSAPTFKARLSGHPDVEARGIQHKAAIWVSDGRGGGRTVRGWPGMGWADPQEDDLLGAPDANAAAKAELL